MVRAGRGVRGTGGGLLIRGEREGEGPTSEGDEKEGREERGGGKGGEGIFPPSQRE